VALDADIANNIGGVQGDGWSAHTVGQARLPGPGFCESFKNNTFKYSIKRL
jgi:hypothetical protein